MSLNSKMGARLSLYRSLEKPVKVELKSTKYDVFIAKVQEFITHGEDDTKVVFGRVEGTVFPDEADNDKQDTYVTYIKNVKELGLA